MVKVLALAALLAVSGCQTTKGTFCLSDQYRPSQATIDAMTDEEVAKVLGQLEKGAALCGWKK